MDSSFGILPFPKLDESQKEYRATASQHTAMFTIPVTNQNPEQVGRVFDALSYESDRTVLPEYFGVLVEQKGLRNEESIEMLNIIKETRSFDIGAAYALLNSLDTELGKSMLADKGDYASKIAARKSSIQGNIDKMMDVFNQ